MEQVAVNKSKKETIILLLLSTVFLIVSTYAWFSTNTSVRVNTLDIYVEAGEGLQISLDGLNWKTVIQSNEIIAEALKDTYAAHKNHLPEKMYPASTATHTDSSGYMEMFLGEAVLDDTKGSLTYGEYIITATKMSDERETASGYAAFDLFFKTNSDMDLYVQTDAGVYDIAADDSPNYGKGIENAARIGFVNQGDIPITDPRRDYALAAAAQGLQYTDFSDGRNVTIWEPNFDDHTENAKIDTYNFFGILDTDLIWDNEIFYDGVYANIASPILLNQNNATLYPQYFERIPDSRFFRTEKATRTDLRKTDIILYAGVTKVRVYLWLEGQDYDCQDSASGSDISFVLSFQGENVGTGP